MKVWSDNAGLIDRGVEPVLITGHWHCFDDLSGQGDYDLSRVSLAAIDRAAEKLADWSHPILLDVECFDLAGDFDVSVANLVRAVTRWKSANVVRQIGLYEIIPRRDFWSPVHLHITTSVPSEWSRPRYASHTTAYAAWQRHNDRVAERLIDYVDFLCPSLYAFEKVYDKYWPRYALANIAEAKRVSEGKPVIPIHWPFRHGTREYVGVAAWKMMVEVIAESGVDGMIAYGPDGVALPTGWDEQVIAVARESISA